MTPSPALDLLVFRAYQKMQDNHDGDAFIEDRPNHLLPNEKPHLMVCWELEGGSFEAWSPSTQMAHAWALVEMLSLLDPSVRCIHQHGCARNWIVELVGYKPVTSTSAPLAICHAFLEAAK